MSGRPVIDSLHAFLQTCISYSRTTDRPIRVGSVLGWNFEEGRCYYIHERKEKVEIIDKRKMDKKGTLFWEIYRMDHEGAQRELVVDERSSSRLAAGRSSTGSCNAESFTLRVLATAGTKSTGAIIGGDPVVAAGAAMRRWARWGYRYLSTPDHRLVDSSPSFLILIFFLSWYTYICRFWNDFRWNGLCSPE